MTVWHYLDADHRVSFFAGDAEAWPTDDERIRHTDVSDDGRPLNTIGCHAQHRRPDTGEWCGGGAYWVSYKGNGPKWTLVSLDPLHVEPSLACRAEGCTSHGFIRDGKWIEV